MANDLLWETRLKMHNGNDAYNAMHVPDRIIVAGQEQHLGTKALPRELQLDTAVMPPDPEIIRINTPPRSITLLNSPTSRFGEAARMVDEDDEETLIVENDKARLRAGSSDARFSSEDLDVGSRQTVLYRGHKASNGSALMNPEQKDELEHLREQLSRMNRRILAVEEDVIERKEKEKYLFMAGIFYVAYKAMNWIFRGNQS